MKAILFLLFFISFASQAQEDNTYRSTVFNLYRKDANVINSYSYEFAKKIFTGKIDTSYSGVTLNNYVFVRYDNSKCYDSLFIYGQVLFMAKDNRVRVEFSDVKYKIYGFTGTCPTDGSLKDYFECKECKLRNLSVREKVSSKFDWLAVYYKQYVAKKAANDKENW